MEGEPVVPGNWKQEAILGALAEAKDSMTSSDIAHRISLTTKQVAMYILYNLAPRYVHSEKIPVKATRSYRWVYLHTLTEQGRERYRRHQVE